MQRETTSSRIEQNEPPLVPSIPRLLTTASFLGIGLGLLSLLIGCGQYGLFSDRTSVNAATGFTGQPPSPSAGNPASVESEVTPAGFETVKYWEYEEAPSVPSGYRSFRRLQRLSFAPESTSLNHEGRGALIEVRDDLEANSRWHVLLVGFADAEREGANGASVLGFRRAEAVKSWLVANGIDESRISLQSLGSKYAEGDQFEPQTMASDRRVEIWAFMQH